LVLVTEVVDPPGVLGRLNKQAPPETVKFAVAWQTFDVTPAGAASKRQRATPSLPKTQLMPTPQAKPVLPPTF
jgi:hypothetical protein